MESTVSYETVAQTPQSLRNSGFDLDNLGSLRVSEPIEYTKYAFMSMLLKRILNLENGDVILDSASYKQKNTLPPVEILPHIAVPGDLWLSSEVSILRSGVKIELLKEINDMISEFIGSFATKEFMSVDIELLHTLEERISSLKVNHTDSPGSLQDLSNEDFVTNQDSEESHSSKMNTSAEVDAADITPSSSRPVSDNITRNTSRVSSFSRDFIHGKRKLSFFGNYQMSTRGDYIVPDEERKLSISSPVSLASSEPSPTEPSLVPHVFTQKASQINGLLSKSKFYNKLVKRRESSMSTATISSMNSTQHSVDYGASPEGFNQSGIPLARYKNVSPVSATQKIENQKAKYRFYSEIGALADNIYLLTTNTGRPGSQHALSTLMEFVKDCVFKFVMEEVCQMIIARAQTGFKHGSSMW